VSIKKILDYIFLCYIVGVIEINNDDYCGLL